MIKKDRRNRKNNRGSALLVSLMVMVGLSLLGLGFVAISETESTIAKNQSQALQTLTVAEAGAKMAVEWFQDPLWGMTHAGLPANAAFQGKTRTPITWSTALPKAAISGFATVVFLVAILALTKSAFSLLIVIPLGGVLSVWLYARGKDPNDIAAGIGARVGAVTGLFSYLIYGIIVAAQVSSQKGMIEETMRKAIEQAVARDPNPQTQAMMNQIMTPEGIATILERID